MREPVPRPVERLAGVLRRPILLLAYLVVPALLACLPRTTPSVTIYGVGEEQRATSSRGRLPGSPDQPLEPRWQLAPDTAEEPSPPLEGLDDPSDADTLTRPLIHDPALAALVDKHFGSLQGHFGVAIKDLETGQGLLVHGADEFEAASLFKLPVMYEVFRQRDSGLLSLEERLTITPYFASFNLGTLDLPVGQRVSVAEALQRMITRSDNTTANMLLDRVGAWRVNQTVRELELRETRIEHERLTTSPRDQLRLLESIMLEQGPSAASSQDMLRLLLDQQVNDRLPARLPLEAQIAHKTGNLPGVVHDVGIVYAPGATFVIVLLAEKTPHAGLVAQAQAALSRAVYDYLSPLGRTPPPAQLRVGGWGQALAPMTR